MGRHYTAALMTALAFAALPMALAPAQTASPSKMAPVIEEEPRDIVAAIYKLAIADAKKTSPASPFFDRKTREKYFSKSFDVLVTAAETKAAHDGSAALDFDPISASQDAELQKVTLKTDVLEPGKAVVTATFLNHKQPTIVTYDFVRTEGDWKINDIKGTTEKEAWSVRKILKATGEEPKALPGMPAAAAPPDASAPLPPKKDATAK